MTSQQLIDWLNEPITDNYRRKDLLVIAHITQAAGIPKTILRHVLSGNRPVHHLDKHLDKILNVLRNNLKMNI